MREIKFRAWDKRNKTMEYKNILRQITCFYEYQDINERIAYAQIATNDYILMLYIGMKDKNGKEIYEGDIVKTNEGNWIAKVVYSRDGFLCIDGVGGFSTDCDWEKFEVIGNIYQNPELKIER